MSKKVWALKSVYFKVSVRLFLMLQLLHVNMVWIITRRTQMPCCPLWVKFNSFELILKVFHIQHVLPSGDLKWCTSLKLCSRFEGTELQSVLTVLKTLLENIFCIFNITVGPQRQLQHKNFPPTAHVIVYTSHTFVLILLLSNQRMDSVVCMNGVSSRSVRTHTHNKCPLKTLVGQNNNC